MTAQTAERTKPFARPTPAVLCLVSIDPGKNRYRSYRISQQRTLWGEDVLVQTWGRLGTDGRSRVCFLESAEQAEVLLAKLLRRRLQHGYQLVEAISDASSYLHRD
jgi:predicted DNA-binding WGR domain protein